MCDPTLPSPTVTVPRAALRHSGKSAGTRTVPEETAIAFTYNRASYAVMMASPADLEDFATGFSLAEGIISSPSEIASLEIVSSDLGVELRMELTGTVAEKFTERRRLMAGPVGCGLCGIESLTEAMRPLPRIGADIQVSASEIANAVSQLSHAQEMGQATRSVHAAGYWSSEVMRIVREDVGRHNALDKLAGALARKHINPALGVIVISSRVSVEMVQKAAMMGAPILVAISAPTALAIRTAERANITLAAVARDDGFEVFTNGERIAFDGFQHVAR